MTDESNDQAEAIPAYRHGRDRNIVAIAGDPGGAAALVPVLLRLSAEGRYGIAPIAYRQAPDIWSRAGITPQKIAEDVVDVISFLRRQRPILLLTATSVNGVDHEKAFWRAAAELGIPSLAVLDFWSNYRARFSDATGSLDLPDRIAAMDALAARRMAAVGFPPDRLAVTGQPAFDAPLPRATPGGRHAIRARLGLGPRARLVLFASQPLAAYYGKFAGNSRALGYDERSVAHGLRAALSKLTSADDPITLCILPHPREPRGAWRTQAGAVLTVIAPKGIGAHCLAAAADLVVGMNSAFLIDCCRMGLPTLSLQPGLRGEDALPSNAWKATVAVRRWSALPTALRRLLKQGMPGGRWLQRRRLPFDGRATEQVLALIDEMTR